MWNTWPWIQWILPRQLQCHGGHEGNRTAPCIPAATHWAWCIAEAEVYVVSTITHLSLRPSCWETLQACHKIWPKASSSPRKTFPLTLVEFESNLWSPMSLCWHYILFSLITKKLYDWICNEALVLVTVVFLQIYMMDSFLGGHKEFNFHFKSFADFSSKTSWDAGILQVSHFALSWCKQYYQML